MINDLNFNDLDYFLSPDFKLKEFKVSKTYPDIAEEMTFNYTEVLSLQILCQKCIQPIRNKFGKTGILSGYRNKILNAHVGGAADSDHLYAAAADIICFNFDMEAVFRWVVEESDLPYRQVIYYPQDNFLHISWQLPVKEKRHEALVRENQSYITYFDYTKKKELSK